MEPKKSISPAFRHSILHRDKYACQYCGARAPDVKLHIDHIIPLSEGGLNVNWNLIASCETCNTGKGATITRRLMVGLWRYRGVGLIDGPEGEIMIATEVRPSNLSSESPGYIAPVEYAEYAEKYDASRLTLMSSCGIVPVHPDKMIVNLPLKDQGDNAFLTPIENQDIGCTASQFFSVLIEEVAGYDRTTIPVSIKHLGENLEKIFDLGDRLTAYWEPVNG